MMAIPDSQPNHWSLWLINNMKDILFFSTFKRVWFRSVIYDFVHVRNAEFTFVEKPQLKIRCFQNYKHWYLIHTRPDKAFKGTVVNWTSPCLLEGSLEITLTVPINQEILGMPIYLFTKKSVNVKNFFRHLQKGLCSIFIHNYMIYNL